MKLNPYVVHRSHQNEMVLLNSLSGDFFSLNETGSFIWMKLIEQVSLEDILVALTNEYSVKPAAAQTELQYFIQSLKDNKIIEA